MYRSLLVLLAAFVAALAAGCAPSFASGPGTGLPAHTPETVVPVMTPDLGILTPTAGSAGAPAPDVADKAAEWLAKEVNVARVDLGLVKVERAEWTDSCFGLGGPAESCLQALTPGWRITFAAAGKQYEVRADESGSSFRLAPLGS